MAALDPLPYVGASENWGHLQLVGLPVVPVSKRPIGGQRTLRPRVIQGSPKVRLIIGFLILNQPPFSGWTSTGLGLPSISILSKKKHSFQETSKNAGKQIRFLQRTMVEQGSLKDTCCPFETCFFTKIKGNHHLQENVQVYNVGILDKSTPRGLGPQVAAGHRGLGHLAPFHPLRHLRGRQAGDILRPAPKVVLVLWKPVPIPNRVPSKNANPCQMNLWFLEGAVFRVISRDIKMATGSH